MGSLEDAGREKPWVCDRCSLHCLLIVVYSIDSVRRAEVRLELRLVAVGRLLAFSGLLVGMLLLTVDLPRTRSGEGWAVTPLLGRGKRGERAWLGRGNGARQRESWKKRAEEIQAREEYPGERDSAEEGEKASDHQPKPVILLQALVMPKGT